jgi:hypothetical protein
MDFKSKDVFKVANDAFGKIFVSHSNIPLHSCLRRKVDKAKKKERKNEDSRRRTENVILKALKFVRC